MSHQASVEAFFDAATGTVSYVVADPGTRRAAIIDPVLDYAASSGRTSTHSADRIMAFVRAQQLTIDWIIETHAHADHLSAAQLLKQQVGGRVAIGARIGAVQRTFKAVYHLGPDFVPDGSQFDHLFEDDERISIGSLAATVLFVPGHTPADIALLVGDALFAGDTLFMPDVGTARADFPGGDAAVLYRSVKRLLALPGETRVFVCHDYPPPTREAKWVASVGEQRASNVHVHDGITEDAFVRMRTARDATLGVPALILPAIQLNVRAGHLPPPEANGVSYFKLPINAFGPKLHAD